MFNVIFYENFETTELESGETITNRVPSRFVCTTMTSADEFFKESKIQKFDGSFPALNSANYMFQNSSIEYVKHSVMSEEGTIVDVPANFDNLTSAFMMFTDCKKLTNVSISMKSLTNGDDMFSGCTALETISGNMDSITYANGMFSECPNLSTFQLMMPRLEYGDLMLANTKVTTVNNDFYSLQSAREMYKSCTALGEVEVTFPSLIWADSMFSQSSLTSITMTAPSLVDGSALFQNCDSLTTATCNFESLLDGENMFNDCAKLTSAKLYAPKLAIGNYMFSASPLFSTFEGDLRGLKEGKEMFKSTAIISFNPSSLDSLENGNTMFYGNNFLNWNIDLPNLIHGQSMFEGSIRPTQGTGLHSFSGNLDKLENGKLMFKTSTYLTEFDAALPSLKYADEMFMGCKLSPASVMNIIETIPTYTDGSSSHIIGIGINSTSSDLDNFAAQTGIYNTWEEMKSRVTSKGWIGVWYDSNEATISV